MLVLFQAGNNKFGILKSHVLTIESDSTAIGRPDSGPISTVTLDGKTMPRFDLSLLLGKGDSSQAEKDKRLILATTRAGTVALQVDKVEDSIEINAKQILPMPPIFVEPAVDCFPSVLRLQEDLIPLLDPNGIPKDSKFYGLENPGNVSADSSVTEGDSLEPPASMEGFKPAEFMPEEHTEETGFTVEEESISAVASLPDLENDAPLPETTVDQDISPNEQLTEDLQEIAESQADIKENITPPEETYPAPTIKAEGPLLVIDQQPACPPQIKAEATEPSSSELLPEEPKEAETTQQHPLSANEEETGAPEINELQDTTPSTNAEEISFAQDPDFPNAALSDTDPADERLTEEDSQGELTTEIPEANAVREEEALGLSSLETALLDSNNEDSITELSPADDLAMPAVNENEEDIKILAPEDAVSLSEEKPQSSGFGSLMRRFSERQAKKRAARRRTLTS